MAAPVREIVSSHVIGRCRNVAGASRYDVPPTNSGVRMPPINPMSWYAGSQKTPDCGAAFSSTAGNPKPARISSKLWSRLP